MRYGSEPWHDVHGNSALHTAAAARAVIIVEGVSDQLAIEALAARRGRDLVAERVSVASVGGSKGIGRFLDYVGPRGLDLRLAGLCDAAEESDFRSALERAGVGSGLSRGDMEELGFYVCVEDLEDELIRSLGVGAAEQVICDQDELQSFRSFQRQPAWQGRAAEAQLRRFFGTRGGRKIRSAPLLVNALDLTRVPKPLDGVLGHL